MGIRADGKECGMTETDEARVADQQHQPYAGDRVYQYERKLTNIKFVKTQWCQQDSDRQQAIPESLTSVFKEANVLPVPCLEYETQN